jgi:hypothetical protein
LRLENATTYVFPSRDVKTGTSGQVGFAAAGGCDGASIARGIAIDGDAVGDGDGSANVSD